MRFSIIITTAVVATLSGLAAAAPAPPLAGFAASAQVGARAENIKLARLYLFWWKLFGSLAGSLTEYDLVGEPAVCNEISKGWWDSLTGSIQPVQGSAGCNFYRGLGCTGEEIYVPPTGISVWEGKSKSYKCYMVAFGSA